MKFNKGVVMEFSFDKFSEWVVKENIALLGLMGLIGVGIIAVIVKTAWGAWKQRD